MLRRRGKEVGLQTWWCLGDAWPSWCMPHVQQDGGLHSEDVTSQCTWWRQESHLGCVLLQEPFQTVLVHTCAQWHSPLGDSGGTHRALSHTQETQVGWWVASVAMQNPDAMNTSFTCVKPKKKSRKGRTPRKKNNRGNDAKRLSSGKKAKSWNLPWQTEAKTLLLPCKAGMQGCSTVILVLVFVGQSMKNMDSWRRSDESWHEKATEKKGFGKSHLGSQLVLFQISYNCLDPSISSFYNLGTVKVSYMFRIMK